MEILLVIAFLITIVFALLFSISVGSSELSELRGTVLVCATPIAIGAISFASSLFVEETSEAPSTSFVLAVFGLVINLIVFFIARIAHKVVS